MLKHLIKFIVSCSIFILITGCALTTEHVSFNYHPPVTKAKAPAGSKTITVGNFQDERDVEPAVLANKINGYGKQATGKYVVERPVADILHDAFEEAFNNADYHIVNRSPEYTLTGKISEVAIVPVDGFFAGDIKYTIKCHFKLVLNKSGSVVWADIIAGHAKLENKVYCGDECYLEGFRAATDNLIAKLLKSHDFKHAVSR